MPIDHVEWFDSRKEFGFISLEGYASIFVHRLDLDAVDGNCLYEGQAVSFDTDEKGGRATNVRVV